MPSDTGDTRGAIGSFRRAELLAAAHRYVLANGATDMSLRPLAASTGTSPRVLLYLFGSKDGLLREILARGRSEQRELLDAAASDASAIDRLWEWLSAPEQRETIRLFVEAYSRSLHPEPGPWEGFGRDSVEEWLATLDGIAAATPGERTLTLAVLRGLLLDLLATGDDERVNAAYRRFRTMMSPSGEK